MEHFAMSVLLTGEAQERETPRTQAAALRGRGAMVAVFAGTAEELGLRAGLVAGASVFLGGDTGPGAVDVVQPLPIFGCRWVCVFGQTVCLDGMAWEAVVRALSQAMTNP